MSKWTTEKIMPLLTGDASENITLQTFKRPESADLRGVNFGAAIWMAISSAGTHVKS